MSRLWSWLTAWLHPGPHRAYIPDEDPDILELRRMRRESEIETQRFIRQRSSHQRERQLSIQERIAGNYRREMGESS